MLFRSLRPSAAEARDRVNADLHFHILPGIDDGPSDLAESLELARAAVAEGTSVVVATPHVRLDLGTTDTREIAERTAELQGELARAGIPLELRCGGELGDHVVGRLTQSELERLAQGPAGSRWLLVETPFHGLGADFHAATAELRERGFGVLLAHPERSADATLDGCAGLRRELEAGSLAQLNAPSLTGGHGEEVRAAAWSLVESGYVAVIGSDAHGPTRPPALGAAREALTASGAEAMADEYIRAAPRRLLESGIRPRAAVSA